MNKFKLPVHVHSFRVIGKKLYCIHPECFHKYSPFEIHGHFVKCSMCTNHFIYNMDNYGPKVQQITCSNCLSGTPYILTLEMQKEMLGNILLVQVQKAQVDRSNELDHRESALVRKEKELAIYGAKLVHASEAIGKREKQVQFKRKQLTIKLRDMRKRLHKALMTKEKLPKTHIDETPGEIVLDEIAKMLGKTQ